MGYQPPPLPPYPPVDYGLPPRPPKRSNTTIVCIVLAVLGACSLPVIGIIASISIPMLLSARDNAVNEKARNALRTVVSAEAAYYRDTGSYGTGAQLYNGGASPTYLDARFDVQDGVDIDLGNGVFVNIDIADDGQGYTATAMGIGRRYTADEKEQITET